MRLRWSTTILSVIGGILVFGLILLFQAPDRPSLRERSYSDLLRMGAKLSSATIVGDELVGSDDDGTFTVRLPKGSPVADRLAQGGTAVTIRETPDASGAVSLLSNWLPFFAYLLVLGVPLFRIARALETLTKQGAAPRDEAR